MQPAKINLNIYQGATFNKVLVWKAAGAPVDLTGFTARMQIREVVDSAAALIELTTGNGRITITPLEGKITLSIAAPDTALLQFSSAVYDMELIIGTEVIRFCEGKVRLSPEVTR